MTYASFWYILASNIEFVSDSEHVRKFRLSAARCTEMMSEDISGIYGTKWQQEEIKGLPVHIAEISKESPSPVDYTAHWTHNNMLFCASSENMTYMEFWRLL